MYFVTSCSSCHEVLDGSGAAFCSMPVTASPWRPWLQWRWGYISVASWLCDMRLIHGYVMALSWLCGGCCISQKRGYVWMLSQPGENKLVCGSVAPRVSFQPLSSMPCLPWGQRAVWTVWTARQLVLWTGWRVIQWVTQSLTNWLH